ncbi:TetR/AcrR family transcriptional regulator [Marinobacterium sediminicola]|uniref:Transcriptional regulator, TetR family n=1 Tax=Marinobacterium sediminicola TaxID=518898 RepID=A0ABY1RXJ3_9GAMM|nr:TetR/AcrR family transcriptional regulator [Marinobacterium sediminicola]ULG67770.1 TetR/AcrR family transcriptional regulator [Marinobacterium sediminicola]SMR71578.1 transcriptional regulator, TetR family [Marinobacterium sediminicola]
MSQSRMPAAKRREQLLKTAAAIVATEGADRLTLQTLADRAGVSKPITYNHFGDRKGLLQQLYQSYDERLVSQLRAVESSRVRTVEELAEVLAVAYFDCAERNGDIYDAVVAALSAYPEYMDLKTRICVYFVEFYRDFFGPVANLNEPGQKASLIAIYGASDELARALTAGHLSKADAVSGLSQLISRILKG